MATKALAALTDEELEARMFELQEARGKAEQEFKAEQKLVGAEIDRRAVVARVNTALGTLDEAQRLEVLETLKAGG